MAKNSSRKMGQISQRKSDLRHNPKTQAALKEETR
jgi:hypothetical protein